MADTQYVIDVAADMPDGGVTTAQLDELSQALIDAGASAESLEVATIAVNQQLLAARAATAAANDALAEGNTRYGELERAALQAAKAVEKAKLRNGFAEESELQRMYDAQDALDAYAEELGVVEAAAASAAAEQEALVRTQANLKTLSGGVAKATADQARAFNEAAKAAENEAGKVKRLADAEANQLAAAHKKSIKEAEGFSPIVKQFNDLSDALSTTEGAAIVGVGAMAALATAIVAVTVATIAATIAIAAWAIGLADAKREASLTAEAVAGLHPELAALSGDFQAISDETGASAADLRGWVKQLKAAKVSAEDVPAALRAMAQAEAALGKGGSAEFLDTLKESKKAAGDLAAEYDAALGGVVAKRMMGLDAQTAKLKKNIGSLFGGLNIDPVLEGMRVLVDLFDENTAAGESMKFLFESVFQPLIDQATNAAYVIEAFALGFLIGMTKLYIALKPAIKAVKEFFGFDDSTLTDTLDIAKIAGEAVAYIFAGFIGVLGLLAGAVALVVAPAMAMTAAFYALITAIGIAAAWIVGKVIGAFQAVSDYLTGINLIDVGTNIIMGLANGLMNAGPAVLKAITGVVSDAIGAAKKLLGIASPSKVFAEIGGFTAEGFAGGIDDGTADAQAAMAAMVEPPAPGSPYAAIAGAGSSSAGAEAGAGGAAKAKAAGGKTINFNAPVYFGGAKATQAEVEDLAEAITKILEGDAAAISGEEAAA